MTHPDRLPATVQPTATPGPPDLNDAVTTYLTAQRAAADKMLASTDRDIHAVRTAARPAVEGILAEYGEGIAMLTNASRNPGPTADEELELAWGRLRQAERVEHPLHDEWQTLQATIAERGTVTEHGARELRKKLDTDRDAAIEQALAPLRTRLDDAETRYTELGATPRPESADMNEANECMAQLRGLEPGHGIPHLQYAVRDAARDPKRLPFLRALVPYLKSLYEKTDTPYTRHVDLWTLIGKANAVLGAARNIVVAATRCEEITRLRYDIERLTAAATDGDGGALRLRDAHTDKLTLLPPVE